ncbi:MAG: aldehyde ferredoxin oxidoreductase [Lachnospiraceae bacterium]|nr:aldehyde ferredoxin oxidoreductase [Lachnospiraceae bacterium]
MPNYTKNDVLENPSNTRGLLGYCGKIARIDLTTGEISSLDTYQYVPKYVGGRMIIHRIFWDEVKPGTGALDEGNKFIFMNGPTTGTGIPAGGRSAACAIGASVLPEQFTFGNIGGWFATELKYAGYDGFIIQGKAAAPSIIKIEDDRIEILPADDLWGLRVHQTQAALEEKFGHDFKSMVIGPAGENLVRIASITSANDCALAKGGFGAVWGSKNLKAVTVHGTGVVVPADIEKIGHLRLNMNNPSMSPSPVLHLDKFGVPGSEFDVKYDRGNVACSPGCNQRCNCLLIGGENAFDDEKVNHIEKCVSGSTYVWSTDIPGTVGQFWPSEKNYCAPCKLLGRDFPVPDFEDPYFEEQGKVILPDVYNLWKADWRKGTWINDMCNDYGIDKWEIDVWLQTWIGMGVKEGLFDDMDLGTGMEVDVDSPEFFKEFITNLVYRKGYWGNLFAEGMARAIREMGYDRYSDTIFHGRFSNELGGERLDLPVSLEGGWGQSVHWQGRGYEGAVEMPTWLAANFIRMTSSRDSNTVEHFHSRIEYHAEAMADPYHSPGLIKSIINVQNNAEIKDSVMSCEWQSPHPWWPTMEAEMYAAATGYPMTAEELYDAAYRSKLLMRAIFIRNHGRTRRMEIEQVWRVMVIPDSWNQTADWQQWNEFVDLLYDERGWDRETGWPYRETYEKYGLKDVADEMEALGFLPERPAEPWHDYGEPPFVKFVENRAREAAERGEAE